MPSINNFLNGFSAGLPGMKDYRHASRLYLDDNFKLAPKNKFLFHVVFDIDTSVIQNPNFNKTTLLDLNMLVKAVDLPKYNMNVEEKQQYNKKTYIATRIQYSPVNITFHDDNADTVNAFWKSYYEYMIADSIVTNPSMRTMNKDTFYDNGDTIQNTQFGLDTASVRKKPLIRGVDIFVLHKQRFTSFSLINPVIASFSHDQMDQADGQGILQNTMELMYETVLYRTGLVKGGGVPGFATVHYDNEPSPLSVLGGGTTSIFGPGGIVDGVGSVLGDVRSGQVGLGTILKGINTYNNARKIKAKDALKEEIGGIVKDEIKKIGESAGTIANPVGDFSVGAAAATVALSGVVASAKSLNDDRNSGATTVAPQQDTVNFLSSTEAVNLVTNNSEVRDSVATSIYFKDIGSRKGLSVAESEIEYASQSDSVKNTYSNKAVANVNKLVTEGCIKIDRESNDVAIETEKLEV